MRRFGVIGVQFQSLCQIALGAFAIAFLQFQFSQGAEGIVIARVQTNGFLQMLFRLAPVVLERCASPLLKFLHGVLGCLQPA